MTDTTATAIDSEWVARRLAGRWGIQHRPSGRWVAFGSEAQCRRVATRLTEANATLPDPGVPLM